MTQDEVIEILLKQTREDFQTKILGTCPHRIRATLTFEQNEKGEYIDKAVAFLQAIFEAGVCAGVQATLKVLDRWEE